MRKKDPIFISFLAFISILTSVKIFSEILGSKDFEKELISNQQLADSNPGIKQKQKEDIIVNTISRGKLLRIKLLKSIFWMIAASLVGCFIAYIQLGFNLNTLSCFLKNNLLAFLSLFLFAFATLGRIGWEGQSWKGDTVYEQLDNRIFWLCYFLGMVFGILAFT